MLWKVRTSHLSLDEDSQMFAYIVDTEPPAAATKGLPTPPASRPPPVPKVTSASTKPVEPSSLPAVNRERPPNNPPKTPPLSKEQQIVLTKVKAGQSVFYTGSAGALMCSL
jgi:hypothetical protein